MLVRYDLDQPHLAGAGQVGAAAGAAVAAGFHQPHGAFQLFFAAVFGFGQRRGVGHIAAHRRVGAHGVVGGGFGLGQLFGRQWDAGIHAHPRLPIVEPHVLGPKQAVQRAAQDMLAGVLLHGVQPRRPSRWRPPPSGPLPAARRTGGRPPRRRRARPAPARRPAYRCRRAGRRPRGKRPCGPASRPSRRGRGRSRSRRP